MEPKYKKLTRKETVDLGNLINEHCNSNDSGHAVYAEGYNDKVILDEFVKSHPTTRMNQTMVKSLRAELVGPLLLRKLPEPGGGDKALRAEVGALRAEIAALKTAHAADVMQLRTKLRSVIEVVLDVENVVLDVEKWAGARPVQPYARSAKTNEGAKK